MVYRTTTYKSFCYFISRNGGFVSSDCEKKELSVMFRRLIDVYTSGHTICLSTGMSFSRYCRKRGMVIVSIIIILSAVLGFISKLEAIMSPVCLIVSRAFAGLHCGKFK